MIRFCFFLLILSSFCSCKSELPEVLQLYFPSNIELQQGVVNKYYTQVTANDNEGKKETYIETRYYSYQFLENGNLLSNYYNLALNKRSSSEISVRKSRLILEKSNSYYQDMNKENEIRENQYMVFSDSIDQLVIKEYPSRFLKEERTIYCDIKQRQKGFRPIPGKSKPTAELKFGKKIQYFVDGAANSNFDSEITELYRQGIGLFRRETKKENSIEILEFVEQMSLEEFKNRQSMVPKRVSYIDPQKSLSDDANFSLCKDEYDIANYYESGLVNDHRFKGGVGSLKKFVAENIDIDFINGLEGYLTLRFVVNCKGQAGRFVVEQMDLDFQKNEFPEETIRHFVDVFSNVTEWEIFETGGRLRDVYMYINFRIENGQIDEIIP